MKGLSDIKLEAINLGGPEGDKHVTILRRVLRWGPGQIIVRGDPAHAPCTVEATNFQEDSKGLEARAVPESGPAPGEDYPDDDPELRRGPPIASDGAHRQLPRHRHGGLSPRSKGSLPLHVAAKGFEHRTDEAPRGMLAGVPLGRLEVPGEREGLQ